MATDPNEVAHLQQQHQELTHQIEVAEAAMKQAKAGEGGATQTLQNQLQGYKDELGRVQAQMKALGVDKDPDKAYRDTTLAKQAQDQANITTVDVEEQKRQDEAARETMANRNTEGGSQRKG